MADTLKNTARFLVVKYVPDMQRMEPRNVGVILWSDGHVASRFFGEPEGKGKLRPPSFIAPKNRVVYREWVQYWKRNLARLKVRAVSNDGVKFVNAIKKKSGDNYVVVEGGQLLATLSPTECNEAVNEIFDRFVGEVPPAVKLKQSCDRAVKSALPKQHRAINYPFECRVAGKVEHTFTFNYAGIPGENLARSLFQRVDLDQEGSVNSATLMFESASQKKMPKERCGALILDGTDNHKDARTMLDSFATIVDVADLDEAAYTIRWMSGLNGEPKSKH